ncbi:MAG: 50S ribosomal protein L13 [Candidatus Lariskella arthropodorum]|uniref:50S ribosomal protein L13 n=1 Tax=Candidatus Lariskella endosymbiont of Epinotia ramella TaxID=3066224 RepID=UPI0030D01924
MPSYTAGTFNIKPKEVKKNWFIIDVSGMPLGRVAARVAMILRGKHKATFTPHIDCGDNVIVVNAKEIKVTGKKLEQSKFFWHTGYPGGIKERSFGDILSGKFPERLFKKAVERMLPKDSPLARKQMGNLYVYPGVSHPHAGQQPQEHKVKVSAN